MAIHCFVSFDSAAIAPDYTLHSSEMTSDPGKTRHSSSMQPLSRSSPNQRDLYTMPDHRRSR